LKSFDGSHFWVGTDPDGIRWVAKFRGSFLGYRELVFERLLRFLGMSGQQSRFIWLRDVTLQQLGHAGEDQWQLISPLLNEHDRTGACRQCPIPRANEILKDETLDPLAEFASLESSIPGLLDWPRSEILAPLIGANEPPDRLVTRDHRLVVIDGELSFSSMPSDPRETSWWVDRSGADSLAGRLLTRDICSALREITDDEVDRILAIPTGVQVEMRWEIRPILRMARVAAQEFLIEDGDTAPQLSDR